MDVSEEQALPQNVSVPPALAKIAPENRPANESRLAEKPPRLDQTPENEPKAEKMVFVAPLAARKSAKGSLKKTKKKDKTRSAKEKCKKCVRKCRYPILVVLVATIIGGIVAVLQVFQSAVGTSKAGEDLVALEKVFRNYMKGQKQKDTQEYLRLHSYKTRSFLDFQSRLHALVTIIADNDVSLAQNLEYSSLDLSHLKAQTKALLWMARSNALEVSEEMRDVQHAKMLQRYALGVLYYALGGEVTDRIAVSEWGDPEMRAQMEDVFKYKGWYHKENWMADVSVCEWYGITCDVYGLVVFVNLSSNGLQGHLPSFELFQALRHSLKRMDLSQNAIHGSLAGRGWDLVSPMTNLVELKLHNNYLNDTLPFSLGNIASLEVLSLENNNFIGSIPSEWRKLSNLQSLTIYGNSLSGAIDFCDLKEGYFGLYNLKHVEADCLAKLDCECCDKCF